MKNDKRDQTVVNEARAVLRPGNARFAEAASLHAGLEAFRSRHRRRRALQWGLFAAAAGLMLAGGLFVVVRTIDRETPVAVKEPPDRFDIVIESTRDARDDRLVRTRPTGAVVRTTAPAPDRMDVVRTADRERIWEPLTDGELLALFGDRPVGLVARADGRRQLLLPDDSDGDLIPDPE